MVKVLLAVLLFGFSFSGQADSWKECDLNAELLYVRTFLGAYAGGNRNSALEKVKQDTLDMCQEKGYFKCEVIKSWTEHNGCAGFRAHAKVRGEKALELTGEKRRVLLCRKINQCIGNEQGSLEQLEVLFERNECYY